MKDQLDGTQQIQKMGAYLSSIHLFLGRATSKVLAGPFKEPVNLRQRFEFVQKLVNRFW